MHVTFWGVRGSIPAPGPETNRYGGNTSCVAVRTRGDALIIIDMGTGVVRLGEVLMAGAFGKGRDNDGDGLVATLYGPSRVTTKINGVAVEIQEKTAYPFGFDIEFTIKPERQVEFPLRFRVPSCWQAGRVRSELRR